MRRHTAFDLNNDLKVGETIVMVVFDKTRGKSFDLAYTKSDDPVSEDTRMFSYRDANQSWQRPTHNWFKDRSGNNSIISSIVAVGRRFHDGFREVGEVIYCHVC